MRISPISSYTQVLRIQYEQAASPQSPNRYSTDTVSFGKKPLPITALEKYVENPIKLIFSDVDGTIRPLQKSVPQDALGVIKEMANNNVPVILCSGRTYKQMGNIIQSGIKCQYYITEQGSVICDNAGKIMYSKTLEKPDAEVIIEKYLEKYGKDKDKSLIMYFEGQPYVLRGSLTPKNPTVPLIEVDSFNELFKQGFLPTKAQIYVPGSKNFDNLKPMYEFFNGCLGRKTFTFLSSVTYCEITHVNATKGNAMAFILKRLGVNGKNAAAIGDAGNDIPMLMKVKGLGGVPIAMGNAISGLKDVAQFVTGNCQETNGGFVQAMSAILKNNHALQPTPTV